MKTYDAIIIGGGGGLKLRPISDIGKKIAVIEMEDLGGTCLNRGCIPSKMLIHPADVMKEIRDAKKFHITTNKPTADFETIVRETTTSVSSTSHNIAQSYEKKENVDFYHAQGKFVENKIIDVAGEKITAEKIFIATGSRPSVPNIEGLESTPYMTSREALRNTKLPEHLIVIGGGFIALELGHFYREMGSKVTFLIRSKPMRNLDDDIINEFVSAFNHDDSMKIGCSPKKVTHTDEKFHITCELSNGDVEEIVGNALLVATGITPNSNTLDLHNTDIEMSEKGFITVNDRLQTSVDGVYALGDVIGNYFFRHSVNFEGEYLLRVLYDEPSDEPIVYPPMPSAVFTNPQIGSVGKTEKELQQEGVDYFKGVNPYSKSAMGGDALKSEHGFCKLLFDRSSKKLLGAHIIGWEASTMIHMCIAYMNMNATLDDMLRTIYIHPALPEIVRNAARKAEVAYYRGT